MNDDVLECRCFATALFEDPAFRSHSHLREQIMSFFSEIVMVLFGAAIGFLSGAFPSRALVRGTTYALSQDLHFKVLMIWFTLWLLLGVICIATAIEFRGWYFFGSFLAAGAAARILRQTSWRGDRRPPSNYREEEPGAAPRLGPTLISLFEPQATAFSGRDALVCAALSSLAYRTREEIEGQGAQWHCATRFMESADHLNSGFVMAAEGFVFVAFRGTDQTGDWLTDARMWRRTTPWGAVHAGFLGALDALWPDLVDALRTMAGPRRSLWLTGHSLGGAMAMLAAARLTREGIAKVSGLYTFGQPMVGDVDFRRHFDRSLRDRSFRLVTPRDEVPNQPPGFVHAGTLMYFDRQGAPHKDPGWWWMLRDQMVRDSRGLLGEHSIEWYRQLIERRFSDGPGSQGD